ncbi:hypothetical protein MMC31_000076 [Peltigera leucophlebia]|nr:hypothetical protein [Peltigera leucophlebia]
MNGGRWLHPRGSTQLPLSFNSWQPPGCMMHEYSLEDISSCLESRRIVLIGDSAIRNVFWATARKLDPKAADEEMQRAERHVDLNFSRGGVAVQFLWDPFLNSSNLQQHLASHRDAWDSEKDKNEDMSTALLVIGGGLWHAKHFGAAALEAFKASMETIVSSMIPGGYKIMTAMSPSGYPAFSTTRNILMISPVESPSLYPALAEPRLDPAEIRPLNEHLQKISTQEGAPVAWSYNLMTQGDDRAYQTDGFHVIDDISRHRADVMLNLRCNADITRLKGYPMDKTCCNRYPEPTWVQTIIIISVNLTLRLSVKALTETADFTLSRFLPSFDTIRAMLVLALALCYSYLADRTHFFSKSQKLYSPLDFRNMCLVAIVLGILSLRRSVSKTTTDQPFLSRDQTEEWKGWMQFGILIYHYTGASRTLEIYKTDYLFYYFAPLITFWFLVIYFTMKAGCSRNLSTGFLLGKILISAMLVTALIRIPGILEGGFFVLERTCHIHWNLKEWRFRLQLDSYIVYVGMIYGIYFVRISAVLRGDHKDNRLLYSFIRCYWLQIRLSAIATSFLAVPLFWHFEHRSKDKYTHNAWVPYVSWVPILSFVFLRNCSRHTRNFHFAIFSWLGRHSLETFTLQFHIWLAGDTKGLLAFRLFGPKTSIYGRWLDFVFITIIFFWLSCHVAAATATVTAWIVGSSTGEMEDEGEIQLELPRTKSRAELKGHTNHNVYDKMDGATISFGGLYRLVKRDLRVRVVIILGVMWILNVVSA